MSGAEQARLERLFTAIVLGRWSEVRALRRAAGPGEPDRAWREAVLQTHLFAGFPRLVEAYGVLAEEGGLGACAPEELEEPPASATEAASSPTRPSESATASAAAPAVEARGRALFERIYGDGAADVRALLALGHADFARFVERHAYGRVLARPGLSAARRERLAVAALAALGQERQLASHARGAVRCGATPAEVSATLDAIADLVEPARLERAREVVTRFARPD